MIGRYIITQSTTTNITKYFNRSHYYRYIQTSSCYPTEHHTLTKSSSSSIVCFQISDYNNNSNRNRYYSSSSSSYRVTTTKVTTTTTTTTTTMSDPDNNHTQQQSMVFSKPFIGAIDQGTSSTRFMLFDSRGQTVLSHQIILNQYHPNPGWVEHDGKEIIQSTNTCIDQVMKQYYDLKLGTKEDIKAIGITNQRETTIVWDKETGTPYHRAIVWCDTRTTPIINRFMDKIKKLVTLASWDQSQQESEQVKERKGKEQEDKEKEEQEYRLKNYFREKCGLPISNYFSGLKMRWLLDNVQDLQTQCSQGRALIGTIDSWLVWNLTRNNSNNEGGVHITDVTNASRTMLMNLKTLGWDKEVCEFMGIPTNILPTIKSSAEVYGYVQSGPLQGVPIASVLGDQQSAMVGQMCFEKGQAKNTYGTGCFMLYNTGDEIVQSTHGLLTTVCYKLGPQAPVKYALEGSVAVAGAGVRWLVDNLGIASSSQEVEDLAGKVPDSGGMYIVPAFSGLFAPYWREDARGVMVGLTHHTNKSHIARAMLESTCFQTYEVLNSMEKDANTKLIELRVDGGMTRNNLLMQIQADILGLPVVKPQNLETTCFGAAFAAGLAVGVFDNSMKFVLGSQYSPNTDTKDKAKRIREWNKAVSKSTCWVEKDYE